MEQLVGILERESANEDRIDEGEHRGVHADAEREGKNRDCREAGVLEKHSHGVLEVLHQGHRAVYESEAGSVLIRSPHRCLRSPAHPAFRVPHPGFDIQHSALLASSDMPQGTAHLAAITLASRFTLFVTERFPFAAAVAAEAFEACGGAIDRDEASIEALRSRIGPELRARIARLAPAEPGETTPGISSQERVAQAVDEVVEACDGFLRRAAIRPR